MSNSEREKIMILGSNSDIAKAIIEKFNKENKNILSISRKDIDFHSRESTSKVNEAIGNFNPDSIINCVGFLGNNDCDYSTVFDVNFKPNWNIVQYYINNPSLKKVKFVMLGSSSYSSGRKDYMLYTASKASIYSLFLSASSMFNSSNTTIGLINIPRVKTKMISHLVKTEDECLSVDQASSMIINFLNNLEQNNCINIGVK